MHSFESRRLESRCRSWHWPDLHSQTARSDQLRSPSEAGSKNLVKQIQFSKAIAQNQSETTVWCWQCVFMMCSLYPRQPTGLTQALAHLPAPPQQISEHHVTNVGDKTLCAEGARLGVQDCRLKSPCCHTLPAREAGKLNWPALLHRCSSTFVSAKGVF